MNTEKMTDELPFENSYDASELITAIGQVAVSFGACQESALRVFWRLSDMPFASANTIFNVLKSDSSQRDITEALAISRLVEYDPVLIDIKIAMRNLGSLSAERNAAIHTIWENSSGDRLRPSQWILRHHGKLRADSCLTQFRVLAENLLNEQMQLNRAFIALCGRPSFPHAENVEFLEDEISKLEGVLPK